MRMLDAVLIAATLCTASSVIYLIAHGEEPLMWEGDDNEPRLATSQRLHCSSSRCNDGNAATKDARCCGHPEREWVGNGERSADENENENDYERELVPQRAHD